MEELRGKKIAGLSYHHTPTQTVRQHAAGISYLTAPAEKAHKGKFDGISFSTVEKGVNWSTFL